MTYLKVKDSDDVVQYLLAEGAGSSGDPFKLVRVNPTRGILTHNQLTVTNGLYSVGDVVGGLITIANATRVSGGKSLIKSLTLMGVQALVYNVFFLSADIATPAADNAAFSLAAADGSLIQGHIPIASTDYKAAANSFNIASLRNINLEIQAAAYSIYAYVVTTVTTSPGTTRLDLSVGFEYLD